MSFDAGDSGQYDESDIFVPDRNMVKSQIDSWYVAKDISRNYGKFCSAMTKYFREKCAKYKKSKIA